MASQPTLTGIAVWAVLSDKPMGNLGETKTDTFIHVKISF